MNNEKIYLARKDGLDFGIELRDIKEDIIKHKESIEDSVVSSPLIPGASKHLDNISNIYYKIINFDESDYGHYRDQIRALTLITSPLSDINSEMGCIKEKIQKMWDEAYNSNDESICQLHAKNLIHVKKIQNVINKSQGILEKFINHYSKCLISEKALKKAGNDEMNAWRAYHEKS